MSSSVPTKKVTFCSSPSRRHEPRSPNESSFIPSAVTLPGVGSIHRPRTHVAAEVEAMADVSGSSGGRRS